MPDSSVPQKHPTLRSADSLLSAIIETCDDAIVSKDLHSIVTSWNQSAERMFGYTAEDMVGQSIERLFPPDRLDEEALIIGRISRGERVSHFETIRIRKDGRPVEVSLTISPIRDAEGKIVGASKIARDITEAKRSMRELEAAHDALKRADRLKVEFLATLSHELRTPLNAILGWTQILKESATPTDVAEGVQVIERNVRLQAQLIEDLLDMSRIEAGKVSLDLQSLDLSAVVDAAIETVRPTADNKGIRISRAFASVEGMVLGDRNRLQQVVWNLLTNAIKFTSKGGKIHVTIHRVNSHVEILVADSGEGIPPDFLPHVFDRFRQADSSTTRKKGGLGIGLAIAKHLAELHGGTLSAASAGLGLGATFSVHLPLVLTQRPKAHVDQALREAEVDAAAAAGNLRGIKVLAVDDEPDSLRIVERILVQSGATVRTASSMQQALGAFADFSPDVVLSDIGMPEHDGYELIERLRSSLLGKGVPAVALTALARPQDRTRALRAGFQLHVAKPVDAEELVAVVQNLAALRKGAGPGREDVAS
jgi:PAS domain S-box-containing protein